MPGGGLQTPDPSQAIVWNIHSFSCTTLVLVSLKWVLHRLLRRKRRGGTITRVEAGGGDKGSYVEGSHGEGGDDRDDARKEDKEEGGRKESMF